MDHKTRPNHAAYLQVLRGMSDEQKLNKAFELSAMTKELFLTGLRERFPAATEDQIRRLYLERVRLCHNRNF